MGRFSQTVFGQTRLPSRAVICAGVYLPSRKDAFRRTFDHWERTRGSWIRYSFGRLGEKEYAVLFGIYGAAMMLETVQLVREGGVHSVFMVGSMYAKSLPVGEIVIPTTIEDRAGVVAVDDSSASLATPDNAMLAFTRDELETRKLLYTEGMVSSVPAVLHGIERIHRSIRDDHRIIGHEMEGSTFLHFTRKHGVRAGALFYVSDNERHSIISGAKGTRVARRKALRTAATVAVAVLQHF